MKATSTLASSGDKEQLQQLCVDQVSPWQLLITLVYLFFGGNLAN